MNENIRLIYVGYLTDKNIIAHISQDKENITLEEIYFADQTIALTTCTFCNDGFSIGFLNEDFVVDWAEDEGRVLKRLDEITNIKQKGP